MGDASRLIKPLVHACVHIVIDVNTRNKKKMITTVTGLELFGVKLQEASKLFGKKFACGCSVTKSAVGTDQIDMQGDFLEKLAELIVKQFGPTNNITEKDIYYIDEKKKKPFFGSDSESDS